MFAPYGSRRNKCVATIYAFSPRGEILILIVRKAPQGTRNGRNTGAAGTNVIYHGKWTSIGGTPANFDHGRRVKHPLQAVCIEFRDEAGLNLLPSFANFTHHDVVLPGSMHSPNHRDLVHLRHYTQIQSLDFFIMEVSWNVLCQICPVQFALNLRLINTSHGEIDAIGYVSTSQIEQLQSHEILVHQNNFFISYFINTFNECVMPFLMTKYTTYRNRWQHRYIGKIVDRFPRIPWEF